MAARCLSRSVLTCARDRDALDAGGDGAHGVHQAHRSGGADDGDLVPGAQVAVRRDPGVALRRVGTGGADEADEVVVDAADVERDLAADRRAVQHDAEHRTGAEQRRELLDHVGVCAVVDDVVERATL